MDPNYWFIVAFCDLHPAAAKQTVPFARCRGGPWSLVFEMETFRAETGDSQERHVLMFYLHLFVISDAIQVFERVSRIFPNPGGVSCGSKVCSLTIVVLF